MPFTRWAVVVAMALTASACGVATTTSPAQTASAHPTALSEAEPVPFLLYTHCGIRELAYAGRYYARRGGPLDDGQGNPPSGWDNPYQRGVLLVSATAAVFSDPTGHRETFVWRPGAKSFEAICS